jgi:hypothetical protein
LKQPKSLENENTSDENEAKAGDETCYLTEEERLLRARVSDTSKFL